MSDRKHLSSEAMRAAFQVRQRIGLSLSDAANPVDIAEKLGIQVWFQRSSSLEGLLTFAPHPVIVLSSLRPVGRIAFTCAHEIGHFYFKHETHADIQGETLESTQSDDGDEFQANAFASYLMMPKTTVQGVFARRHVDVPSATPEDCLRAAQWLGVSYSNLIRHMQIRLKILPFVHAEHLLRQRPQEAAAALHLRAGRGTVFLLDDSWIGRTLDLMVDDVAILPSLSDITGRCLTAQSTTSAHAVAAVAPGLGRITHSQGWSLSVRVARKHFEGRSRYRHIEDQDETMVAVQHADQRVE
jgi:hypothetical protein